MEWKISRRGFIKGTGAAVLALSLNLKALTLKGQTVERHYPYADWEDLYRKKWAWDKIVKGSHAENCVGICSMNHYIKDGIVWRIEQTAEYGASGQEYPDFNPRGCQKGVLSGGIGGQAGEQRIKYPLKRVGNRGEGKWKRISWDEALTEIADKMLDTMVNHTPGAISIALGTSRHPGGWNMMAYARLAALLGICFNAGDSLGDAAIGASTTWGSPWPGAMSSDWFNSDYIILWGFNPPVTRIPDCHFLWEARYNGAKLVLISPDYSPTAMHTDLWLNPKPGTDTALTMGLVHVIIEEKLYNSTYTKTYTDLPFLVREDNGQFLREKDLKDGGREDRFYFWDLKSGGISMAPGTMGDDRKTIDLMGIDPALEGSWEIDTSKGKVKVKPVFELLKRELQNHSPQKTSERTGVHPEVIKRLAREIAKAERPLVITGLVMHKWYHADQNIRTILLLMALVGSVGKKGGGYQNWNAWGMEGIFKLGMVDELSRRGRWITEILWTYIHSEMGEATRRHYGKEFVEKMEAYMYESIKRGWMPHQPKTGNPKVFLIPGDNFLTRNKPNEYVKERLWPKLELIVDFNPRMDTTALYSDIVLPVADDHEDIDITHYHFVPYLHPLPYCMEPMGEAKSDWEILCLLMKKIEERAKDMRISQFEDKELGITRDFTKLYDAFTEGKTLEKREAVVDYILKNSSSGRGITWAELSKRGFMEFATIKPGQTTWEGEGQPLLDPWPQTRIREKLSWPTLTGRQQFYIDHPWYLELGEALPTYAEPLGSKKYPLWLNSSHARWGIHSCWRTDKYMLRLNRGEPILFMNPEDARERGIGDGDTVKVYNDVGDFKVRVKISPSIQRGEVRSYHAWEPYMYEGHRSFQAPIVTMPKPTTLVGGYGHLQFRYLEWASITACQDARVEAEKVKGVR